MQGLPMECIVGKEFVISPQGCAQVVVLHKLLAHFELGWLSILSCATGGPLASHVMHLQQDSSCVYYAGLHSMLAPYVAPIFACLLAPFMVSCINCSSSAHLLLQLPGVAVVLIAETHPPTPGTTCQVSTSDALSTWP